MPPLGAAAHGGDEAGVENIVRIENDVRIVAQSELLQPVQQEVQNIALADVLGVLPLEHPCAAPACCLCCAVGAVIRADYDVYKLLRIVLCTDAVDELADDCLLVSRCNQHRNALAAAFKIRIFPLRQKSDGYVYELIRIAQKEYTHYYKVDHFDSAHTLTSDSSYVFFTTV